MTALPDASVLLAFTLASLVLCVTPGPDMSLFLAKTMAGGRWAGMASMVGAQAGCLAHTLLAVVGVSALIEASATAFAVLKIVGALYLLWLAVDAVRRGSALNLAVERGASVPLARTFWLGFAVNLSNPKVVLFFVTFLPQFIATGDPAASEKLLFLGLYFVAVTAPVSALFVLGADRVVALLRGRPRLMRALDYAFAGLFGAFAVKILTTQGR